MQKSALGTEVKSPQRSEDLQRMARPRQRRGNARYLRSTRRIPAAPETPPALST
jgi:hypothetical protein